MKLRCTHNSIRIRVRKSDLKHLETNERVEESISFAPGVKLSFSITIDRNINSVTARFSNGNVSIALPMEIATFWIKTDEVGIEFHQKLRGDESLHILLEKDFPCGDREGEDKADTFWELVEDGPEAC